MIIMLPLFWISFDDPLASVEALFRQLDVTSNLYST